MTQTCSRAFERASTFAFLLLLSACAGTPRQVHNVARTDLGCDKVEVAEIAKNRYAASGCGKGAVYAELCGGPEGCSWVRLRGAEQAQASTAGGAVPAAAPREIIQAPPPAQREVIQAPPPAQREIIPAPPPAQAAPAAPTSAAPAPAPGDAQAQQAVVAQGELSQPYQAEVPVTPTAQRVEYPPPAPLIETRPPPPAPNYVWAGGYWSWNNANWLWAPGYWASPMYGYNYVPGSWYWANNYWWYGPGGWARPNSTLIVYGVGSRPYRQVYTRSFTPHVHTAYPNRIGSAPLQHGPGPSRGGFQPQSSPLYRYPSSAQNPVQGGVRSSRMGAVPSGGTNYGRTMQPSSASRFGSGPSSGGGAYRSAPMQRMPSSGGSSFGGPSRSPSMGRMGGGSSPSFGGGGRSFGGGGGGGGGGGRSGGMGRMGSGPRH
jgi:hypothetical protein